MGPTPASFCALLGIPADAPPSRCLQVGWVYDGASFAVEPRGGVVYEGVSGMDNKQEVKVQTWGPDRGNPTPRRQVHCCGEPRLTQREAKRWEAREGMCGRSRRCVNLSNESEALLKAYAADEPALSGEIRNLSGAACVLATRGARSLLFLPGESCWAAREKNPS